MARETLAWLRSFEPPTYFIRGKGEAAVLAVLAGEVLADVPEPARGVAYRVAEELDPEDQQLLAGWPATVHLDIAGLGDVLFCHATPRSDIQIITRVTPDERLLPAPGRSAHGCACGATRTRSMTGPWGRCGS